MKSSIFAATILFLVCGCKSKSPAQAANAEAPKPKTYELADVNREMKEAGIELSSTREDLQNFFKAHPDYQVCKDTDYTLIARMQNSKIDANVHDQYISAVFRDGKIFELEVGPPDSAANLPSYCN